MLNKKLSHEFVSDSDKLKDYPKSKLIRSPSWRQAFCLAENVCFTRTPDYELVRRRAEIDPDYAARLALHAKQKQQQKLQQQEQENMSQAAALDLHATDMTSAEHVPCDADPAPSAFISDFAFFEGGAFSVPPGSTMQETAQKSPPMSTVQVGSIIDLFRTLECRFPSPIAPALALAAHPLKANAVFETHYKMASTVSVTISGKITLTTKDLTTKDLATKELEIKKEEEDIDFLAREAIETESLIIEPDDPIDVEIESITMPDIVKSEDDVSETKIEDTKTPSIQSDKVTVAITPRPDNMLDPSVSLLRPAHLVDDYAFPPLDLLQMPVYKDGAIISQETLERSAGLLESVLEDFGIKGEIIHVRPGPVVTLYEFEPAPGVKSSRIIGLSDDIARSMSAISTRVAVIPGRNVIGIELPNEVRDTVFLRELVQSKSFCASDFKLALALGKNIGGEPIIAELAKMPHLLVAGTTGSGKSVAINTMILSLLYRLKPDQCRLIMVDPKMLELSIYDGIPHLLTPVVTDPKKAVTALKWAVREMEERYRKMAKLGVRNIDGFNERVVQAANAGESITCTVQAGFDKETGELLYAQEAMDLTPLPYIVIIVDEMADLMMVAGKEIEGAIQRLAQMARAAGIHLIMATQRPSVDVITGTIKANFPTRISFQVTSRIDSRTILGEHGAETLLGQGDMLHMAGGGRIVRVHGAFVSDMEVEHIVAHLKAQGKPDYLATVTDGEEETEEAIEADNIAEIVAAGGEDSEELYVQAVKVVMRDKKCSTSYIQRRLGIGYNKAASLVERMEREGLVGQANHVGKREILSQN